MSGAVVIPESLVHGFPTEVSHAGLLSAALDTVKQNIIDTNPATILAGFDRQAQLRFAFDFNAAETKEEVADCWERLDYSGAVMWYSVLYGPFKFEAGNEIISTRRLLSVVLLTGDVADKTDRRGMIGLVRGDAFSYLPMSLTEVKNGTPHFEFSYPEHRM